MFVAGDPRQPLLIGRIQRLPQEALAQLDGERLEFSAEREIVLRCGKASITPDPRRQGDHPWRLSFQPLHRGQPDRAVRCRSTERGGPDMELLNATPLAAAYNQGLDAEGRESLVVIAKGSFDLPLDGREARLLDEQQTLLMVDEFHGEPGFPRRAGSASSFPSAVLRCAGAGQRPARRAAGTAVDRGHPRRPGEQGAGGAWAAPVGTGIARCRRGRRAAVPEPGHFYASAFGGSHASPDNPGFMDCYMANPAGCGWFPRSADTAEIVGTPMPATEKLGEPVDSPTAASRRWRSARSAATGRPVGFAGRYDDTWLAERFRSCPPTSTSATSSPRRPTSGPTICAAARRSCCSTSPARARLPRAAQEVPVTFFLKSGHETAQARIDTLLVDCDARRVKSPGAFAGR